MGERVPIRKYQLFSIDLDNVVYVMYVGLFAEALTASGSYIWKQWLGLRIIVGGSQWNYQHIVPFLLKLDCNALKI